MAYCHFELCCDCELGCFSELLLADMQRLSVAAVVFLYQITVYYNKTQQHHFWNFILMTQCKLCMRTAAAAVAVNREVADGVNVVFTDTGHFAPTSTHPTRPRWGIAPLAFQLCPTKTFAVVSCCLFSYVPITNR